MKHDFLITSIFATNVFVELLITSLGFWRKSFHATLGFGGHEWTYGLDGWNSDASAYPLILEYYQNLNKISDPQNKITFFVNY